MIREIKKQARLILSKNYKLFLLPTIMYVFSNFISPSSLYSFFYVDNLFCKSLFLCLSLAFQLFVLPIANFLLYKTSVGVVNQDIEERKTFCLSVTIKDLGIITLIWIVPNILGFVSGMLDGVVEYQQLSQNITLPISLCNLFVMTFLIYLEYKYFACDYYYSLNKGTIMETLQFSFETMKGRFFKYLLLTLSFIPWYLFGAVLSLIFTKLFGEIVFIKFALHSIGCGVYFYFLPYQYITCTLFIKNISKK